MNVEIRENFSVNIYGYSGIAIDGKWAQTGFSLMDRMWKVVKEHSLKHKGINIWVYGENNRMFAGVELEAPPERDLGLELKNIFLPRYAYSRHIGPYDNIGSTGMQVLGELQQKGVKTCMPYVEIYGHWTNDVSKLETELLWCLE